MKKRITMSNFIYILRIISGIAGAAIVLFFLFNHSESMGTPLRDFFTTDVVEETGALNTVAAILNNYRVFDTLFEALLLMIAVMEVLHVSSAKTEANVYQFKKDNQAYEKKRSEIVGQMTGVIYPFVLLVGIFLMVNGHVSPGGGFQGGSILVAGLIAYYIVYPNLEINLESIERFEHLIYLGILLTPILYVFMQIQPANSTLAHQIYMIIMNVLVGIKVFAGLSIIFYRFVYFEGKSFKDSN